MILSQPAPPASPNRTHQTARPAQEAPAAMAPAQQLILRAREGARACQTPRGGARSSWRRRVQDPRAPQRLLQTAPPPLPCSQQHRGTPACRPVNPGSKLGTRVPAPPLRPPTCTSQRRPQGQSCQATPSASGLSQRASGGVAASGGRPPCSLRGLLPSTQAGRALVVPAICPFLQAQRAVCRAIVLRGWLLSRSRVTISQVPAAS